MDFVEVLTRAWQIIWRHKVLWIFGILAGCANSGGGSGNFNLERQRDMPAGIERFFGSIPDRQLTIYIGIAILILLVIVILAIFLGTVGRIGLYRGARQVDEDMETKLTFGELFRGSFPYFWRVFWLNLLVGLLIFTVVVVVTIVAILGVVTTLGIGLVCIIPLLCLLFPLAFFVSLVIEQSSIAIVMENLAIMDGLRRGWEVVRTNVGSILVMWLILVLGVTMIGGLIISLPIFMSLGPLFFSLFANANEPSKAGLTISIICVAAYLPVLILLSGIIRSYIETAWTLTFLRLTKRETPEIIEQPPLPLLDSMQ